MNEQFEATPKGTFIIDGVEAAHTLQCCHCNSHFMSIRGSGNVRGWCSNCHAVTCGAEKCDPCIPFEAKLEHVEGGKNSYHDRLIDFEGKFGRVI